MFRIPCSPPNVERPVAERPSAERPTADSKRLRSVAIIVRTLVLSAAVILIITQLQTPIQASSFGFSMNINFGARQPIDGKGGVFGDTVWNTTRGSQGSSPLFVDQYGDQVDSGATISWASPGIMPAEGIQKDAPQSDITLMEAYLDSPSVIELRDLDRIIPNMPDGGITYSLILYTYGGRDGEKGVYRVGDQVKEHIDLPRFDGTYFDGTRGNLVIFENLNDPNLLLETQGFGPVNAISLVYCLPGDFNGDGQVDADDLEKLTDAINGGETDSDFDVNFDGTVNFDDIMSWIKCSKGTCIGDVNLDGTFDSSDLVDLFQEGTYETDSEADWTSGDWNGDGKFDSGDLLVAFQEGCYESNMEFARRSTANGDWIEADKSATLAVPEPTGWAQLLILISGFFPALRAQRVRVRSLSPLAARREEALGRANGQRQGWQQRRY